MNIKETLLCLSAITFCAIPAAYAQESFLWQHSPDQAIQSAQAKSSPTLVLIRVEAHGETQLSKQVGSAVGELHYAWQGAELVYPEASYASEPIAQKVIHWADHVGATQLPALALLSPDGRPCGLIEGEGVTDAAKLKEELAEMNQNYLISQSAFSQADLVQGAERAQQLHQALQAIDSPCREAYHDVMQQIITLDPEDSLALRSDYQPILTEVVIDEVIQGEVYPLVDAGAYDQAQATLARLIRDNTLTNEQHQLLLAFQAQLLHSQNRTREAIDMIDQAIALHIGGPAHDQLVAARLQLMAQ